MKVTAGALLAFLAVAASAAKDKRTFAVLRFNGDGFLTYDQADPIVNPGQVSPHLHGVMGGNAFSQTSTGASLLRDSTCTTAMIKNDKSNYWTSTLFFQDPKNGSLIPVPLMYMNVYYFFEATNDDIVPFPVGLQMVVGNPATRSPPAYGGGINLDPKRGAVQPIQITCPRQNYSPPSWLTSSDGTTSGLADGNNQQAGAGFPLQKCDGTYSPLRTDAHFPSCRNPNAALEDYKNNMAWPTDAGNGKADCPKGWIHHPHIFYELYWKTYDFDNLWTADGKSQPYVLSNGDATAYSFHADFMSAWDLNTLSTIINTCDAGSSGMDKCPQIPGGLNTDNNCRVTPVQGYSTLKNVVLDKIPGNNPITGWGKGGSSTGGGSSTPGNNEGNGDSASASSTTRPPTTTPSATQGNSGSGSTRAGGNTYVASTSTGTSTAKPAGPSSTGASSPGGGGGGSSDGSYTSRGGSAAGTSYAGPTIKASPTATPSSGRSCGGGRRYARDHAERHLHHGRYGRR